MDNGHIVYTTLYSIHLYTVPTHNNMWYVYLVHSRVVILSGK